MDTSIILLAIWVAFASATIQNCGKGPCGGGGGGCTGSSCGGGGAAGGGGASSSRSSWSSSSSWSSGPSYVQTVPGGSSRWSRWSSWSSNPTWSYSSQSGPSYRRWWSSSSYNMAPRRNMCKGEGCVERVVTRRRGGCGAGEIMQGNRCVTTTVSNVQSGGGCGAGQIMQGNRCVTTVTNVQSGCGAGQIMQGNRCVTVNNIQSGCGAGQVMRGNRCVNIAARGGGKRRTTTRVEHRVQQQAPEPVRTTCRDTQIRRDFMANFENWKGGEVRSCTELVRMHPELCDRQAIREDCCTSCSNRGMSMNMETLRRHHEAAAERAYQQAYRMSKGK